MREDFFGNFNWREKTILVVEDDISSIFYFKEILKDTGARVLIAENGKTALEFCIAHPEIDIVLMDIQLPVMNGYETTKQIKELRPELPVIAQTAHAMTDERIRCREAGCTEYLAKPIVPRELLETLSRNL